MVKTERDLYCKETIVLSPRTQAVDAICEIQHLLNDELARWFGTYKSKVSEKILRYTAAMHSLQFFVREGNPDAFCLVFKKFEITVSGLRSCFYRCKVPGRRDRAEQLLQGVCDFVTSQLK